MGGMPEAVKTFVTSGNAPAVREVQNEILAAYDKDVSKHALTQQVIRINQVWHSIPSQLAKENKKVIYGVVKKGARAKEFEIAIQWLIDAGLVHKINRVSVASVFGASRCESFPDRSESGRKLASQIVKKLFGVESAVAWTWIFYERIYGAGAYDQCATICSKAISG